MFWFKFPKRIGRTLQLRADSEHRRSQTKTNFMQTIEMRIKFLQINMHKFALIIFVANIQSEFNSLHFIELLWLKQTDRVKHRIDKLH